VISVVNLGMIDYATALRLQRSLVAMRKDNRIGDTLLLLEHTPVITLGRNAKEKNIVAPRDFLESKGVELFETDRGGDVTFHGPGQLVAYPIFDLRALTPKLGAVEYVRKLEELLIRTCAHFQIPTQRIFGLTGVWTIAREGHGFSRADDASAQHEALAPEAPAKIAAIGVHISRAVTSHGFALNVSTDLDYFKLIVPCGIADKPVTSIEHETGRQVVMDNVIPVVTRSFGEVFNQQILWLESLDDLLPTPEDTPARSPSDLRSIHGDDTTLA
jgi:lipoyl(octanoyl) transferase